MARALELAARGLYTTTPNPRVGCVIVRDGVVIGEGFHERAGELMPKSTRSRTRERAATIRAAPRCMSRSSPATRMAAGRRVSMPCSPPGSRVVAAMADPNPLKAGGERLRAAGMTSSSDCCRTRRASSISASCRSWRAAVPGCAPSSRPASTAEPRSANGQSQWITGAEARADGHAWRARACAILTGIGTVLQDDPQMTVRAVATTRQPRRVIVDRHGQTPATARMLDGGVC